MDLLLSNFILFTSLFLIFLKMKQIRLHFAHLCLTFIALMYGISVAYAPDVEKAIDEAIRAMTVLSFAMLASNLAIDQTNDNSLRNRVYG